MSLAQASMNITPCLLTFLVFSSIPSPVLQDREPPTAVQGDCYRHENLVAWCIVPFDAKKRGPEERAAMLERIGLRRFAYDYRAEHVPTFDAEMEAIKRHKIELTAWWFPTTLNDEAKLILDVLKRHRIKTQLWVTGGGAATTSDEEQRNRIEAEAARIRPIAEAAEQIGCTVALYNHGGWFGEPENQIAVIKQIGLPNVGIVYNLHHGHDHLDRFPALLAKMMPHLVALNLNGMTTGGDRVGKKILPIGEGDRDLELLRTIRASGYRGPIGILNHTDEDAEARLQDNLDGLDWLVKQLDGKPAGPKPKFRSYRASGGTVQRSDKHDQVATQPSGPLTADYSPELVARLIDDAKSHGDARGGAAVFASAQFACISCHKVAGQGGAVGPDLTQAGQCLSPDEIVESVLWPKRKVKPEFVAFTVATADGKLHQGYKQRETDRELVLRDPATNETIEIAKADIEAARETGTLMPDGLAAAMSGQQRRDLVRFLMDLGRKDAVAADLLLSYGHTAVTFPFDRKPLRPELWPNWQHPVNRERVYDFYAKEAEYFMGRGTGVQPAKVSNGRWQAGSPPHLLPQFPGLDGGRLGHWGNQNETTWADGRWNETELGSLMCGVFRGAGVTVPRGVCVRVGERGEMAACFNPDTLSYDAVWQGGFVKFSSVRHGFVDGLIMDGRPVEIEKGERSNLCEAPCGPFRQIGPVPVFAVNLPERPPILAPADRPIRYRGFYRHGRRVIFAYRIGDEEFLDSPWVEDGKFVRQVAPAASHPLRELIRGGPMQWPQVLETRGSLGANDRPYAIDTIEPPLDNPWKVPLFFGDHDFLPDGSAMIATMQGDVWHVTGLDDRLDRVRWRRFASGLHHALGLVVAGGQVFVLGRNQITRLDDRNSDGEADYYECFSNAFTTSPAGHDFVCGLQRDAAGSFYTASGNQGLVRISADGRRADVLATGFRNPDGLGLAPDGTITVPCSEGEWTPASMICAVRSTQARSVSEGHVGPSATTAPTHTPHFGYGGPRDGRPPDLPLVYLPRGLDNSSGGQAFVSSDRWGPLKGQMIHLSFGAGTHLLLLRDEVDGQMQGAVVPLVGDFLSGVHRGRFSPTDGQFYVSGMAGWGSYTSADGCFQRVRYTGRAVQLPVAVRAKQNGVLVSFASPVDRAIAARPDSHFAQCWNYRYSAGYGSAEFSARHYGARGHDPLAVTTAHVLSDGRSVFLEIPDLQPVNQLHLHLRVDDGEPHDVFATVHKLGTAFEDIPGYKPMTKTIAAHPILADVAAAMNTTRPIPNPWRKPLADARPVTIEAGKNLTFATRSFTVRAGEPIKLTFANPDVMPHNWALVQPGSLDRVGDLVNKLVAEPDAAARQYIPKSDDVLVYTDIVQPQDAFTIHFTAPRERGRYPFLCTFPGHWMVMNGQMIVE